MKKSINPHDQSQTGGVDAVLALLFRSILHQLNIAPEKFNYLMIKYLTNPINKFPQNVKELSTIRGNTKRELLNDTMTWKVFCKGLIFINVIKLDVVITLVSCDDKETTHRLVNQSLGRPPSKMLDELYYIILNDLNISEEEFNERLNQHRINTNISINPDIVKPRNNLKKELTQNNMSWKVFCKGINFLKNKKLIITILLTHANLITTSHSIAMNLQCTTPS